IEDAVLTRFACDITQENCIAVWKCCKDHSSIHTNKVEVWHLIKTWILAERK
uniref:BACK domain-containing protein n=1 Tax=Parascaris univalens TaxID=6257 RepID=A0A914ZXC6_PARUN